MQAHETAAEGGEAEARRSPVCLDTHARLFSSPRALVYTWTTVTCQACIDIVLLPLQCHFSHVDLRPHLCQRKATLRKRASGADVHRAPNVSAAVCEAGCLINPFAKGQ